MAFAEVAGSIATATGAIELDVADRHVRFDLTALAPSA
jgi:hypothetical protein